MNKIIINPSANGWIDKLLSEQTSLSEPYILAEEFYSAVRKTGFVYGYVVAFNNFNAIETKGWTSEELSKVALLNSLLGVYQLVTQDSTTENFMKKVVAFYKELQPSGFNLLKKILPDGAPAATLEKMIAERIKTNDNIISKNFSHILTNALLFIDILAFRQYILNDKIPENYLKKIEETILNIVMLALTTKTNKSKYDDLLIKLFSASVRFTKFSEVDTQNLETLELDYFSSDLEKLYLIDLAGMTMWNDNILEKKETFFLYLLGDLMSINKNSIDESITNVATFISKYKDEIPYFNYSNPVKHFYDQTTQSVILLIKRNKNRLLKEISESGELMVLLANSTRRDLNEKEKKKVKKQLLDICKTIPSLTIFLLPGGGLLLPILIKFIPQMLPSAFNENLDKEE